MTKETHISYTLKTFFTFVMYFQCKSGDLSDAVYNFPAKTLLEGLMVAKGRNM
jgi:hypothetical protein